MEIVRIVRSGSNNVRVLLPNGTTKVITRDELRNCEYVSSPIRLIDIPTYEYVHVMRSGSSVTSVLLANGDVERVPTEFFHAHWHRSPAELEANADAHNPVRAHNNSEELTRRLEGNNSNPDSSDAPRRRRRRRRNTSDGSSSQQRTSYVHPIDARDRVYTSVRRHGRINTSVYLTNGQVISIPNTRLSDWVMVGTREYNQVMGNCTIRTYNLEDCTFGVELEFVANPDKLYEFNQKMRDVVGADRYITPLRYNCSSTTKWSLQTDSSVRGTSERIRQNGFELTSPILRFDENSYTELKNVLNAITTVFEGMVNKTCGTHVHIGNFADNDHSIEFKAKVKSFQYLYGDLEAKVFDRIVSPSRRGVNNHYCRTLSDHPSIINLNNCRYYKMNALNIDGFGTMENRQHQGTLEIKKIWSWFELNGRLLTKYFNRELTSLNPNSMTVESFCDILGMSEETKMFFLTREAELNAD